ncbi:MAG: EFR1 family ferrodoxin [Spirochaetaceae bacterium]|nr:EFR1 family ferrodoxin [Spirochaetaceae bacterium]
MNKKLYYFSGTGNCAAVAGMAAEKIEEMELIPVPQAAGSGEISGGVIGIVCPIYMHFMPHIVLSLAKRIVKADYLFVIYAGGGDLGSGDYRTKRLFKRRGLKLSALFNIPMPSNYAPYGATGEELKKQLLGDVEKRIDTVAAIVNNRNEHFDSRGTNFLNTFIYPGPLYRIGHKMIPRMANMFSADDGCNGCGICEQVCPVHNISISEGSPTWASSCEQCLACLQWCPKEAIQYQDKTADVPRYHHPKITVGDIIAQK